MACCAFVAFLLSQAYVAAVALRRALSGRCTQGAGPAAARWRAGAQRSAAKAAARPARWLAFDGRRIAVALLLSVGSISVAVAVARASPTAAAGLISSLIEATCSGR